MAGTRVKTWTEEALLYADLNAEFDNILSTSDQLIGTPRTAAWDMNGYELILDADGNTSITADTNDRIDFRVGGADIMQLSASAFTLTTTAVTITSNVTVSGALYSAGTEINILASQIFGS